MVMPLLAPAAGRVNFQQLEGALLIPGNLIARLDLDDPGAVQVGKPLTWILPGGKAVLPSVYNQDCGQMALQAG